MKRNQKAEKMRELHRLYRYKETKLCIDDELGYHRRGWSDMVWVPVEKPQFIGWETKIVLSEPASRRRDANELNQILTLLKLDIPQFTKDTYVVKLIRRANKRYRQICSLYWEDRRKADAKYTYNNNPPGIRSWHETSLTPEVYNHLSPMLQKYFVKTERSYPATSFRDSYVVVKYKLGYHFPIHELNVKINKAYSTHRGIPKSDEISEQKKIETRLEAEQYFVKRWGKYYWGSREEEKAEVRSVRKGWKSLIKEAVKAPTAEVDEVIDSLEGVYVRYKI